MHVLLLLLLMHHRPGYVWSGAGRGASVPIHRICHPAEGVTVCRLAD